MQMYGTCEWLAFFLVQHVHESTFLKNQFWNMAK